MAAAGHTYSQINRTPPLQVTTSGSVNEDMRAQRSAWWPTGLHSGQVVRQKLDLGPSLRPTVTPWRIGC